MPTEPREITTEAIGLEEEKKEKETPTAPQAILAFATSFKACTPLKKPKKLKDYFSEAGVLANSPLNLTRLQIPVENAPFAVAMNLILERANGREETVEEIEDMASSRQRDLFLLVADRCKDVSKEKK